MKLITRDTDYAFRALLFIARHKERLVTVRELVEELKIPRPFLRKLLQELNRSNILKSFKGYYGGFILSKPADRIFLTDLMEIFQGKFELNKCIFKKKDCPKRNSCALRRKICRIEQQVIAQLKPISLSSLL